MLVEERKEKIIQILEKDGNIKVSHLTKLFNVSLQTIRRDLETLEADDLIKKVYGGAILNKEKIQDITHFTREKQSLMEKEEIAEIAVKLIEEGDSIALNDSTTNLAIAKKLKEKFKKLTIISNSLLIITELSSVEGFNVILAGGILNIKEQAFFGEITKRILDEFIIDKAFISVSGFSLQTGITDYPLEEVQIQKKLLDISQKSIIIADSSKLESISLIKVRDISDVDILVTDSNISSEIKNTYEKAGIGIICR
ncbi:MULTISPECIES: DeoR/GlpR family DNA-binding transcription regulator [Psychrilyobacter]|uniref:DeoR family transcriptional regulator n=1 Tax=Psychrilyobacter piezotolerans TaxID=2293438 RepID=A0ABX9KJD4_9FUSO|nr:MULTISPECIES: DeoR/GlpR family DNA-binding transcription regulator [Psychrilyobacter]MCS5422944.1 DeoR/GlpR family DNA-binding transcription regulator [Psychrilyobacter sp. S5]NDI77197.1 DeoR/GlpR transcriptional regulator [Psychrilyobacter piezotolerans]RDE64188.1 DeoR/GlpR transcriptional regulator [Psychrilyobacter sp. S5]REI42280.1 DeoR family transcriptional regulator [Psychrilyobacter piezotolerans]